MESKSDYRKEFDQQRKKFKPYAWIFLIDLVAIIIVLPILFFTIEFDQSFLLIYSIITLAVLVAIMPAWNKYNRCPACKKHLGRDTVKHCPSCGVQIR
ncbi:MAG: hypothetical protein C0592_01085 [Marinilabiliales bacterium]|nr:MAG: hypothetical protein C0592_01085 [Marinilabiliales bacterium]